MEERLTAKGPHKEVIGGRELLCAVLAVVRRDTTPLPKPTEAYASKSKLFCV